jgi:hypothetical protein
MEDWPGLPTLPESPRKRRDILRESEDTEGEISIEDYPYRSDPYRSTALENPWPYPTLSSVASSPVTTKEVENYNEEIHRILSNHGFPSGAQLTVENVTKPHYPRAIALSP